MRITKTESETRNKTKKKAGKGKTTSCTSIASAAFFRPKGYQEGGDDERLHYFGANDAQISKLSTVRFARTIDRFNFRHPFFFSSAMLYFRSFPEFNFGVAGFSFGFGFGLV